MKSYYASLFAIALLLALQGILVVRANENHAPETKDAAEAAALAAIQETKKEMGKGALTSPPKVDDQSQKDQKTEEESLIATLLAKSRQGGRAPGAASSQEPDLGNNESLFEPGKDTQGTQGLKGSYQKGSQQDGLDDSTTDAMDTASGNSAEDGENSSASDSNQDASNKENNPYDVLSESQSEMEASRIPWRTPTFTIVAQNRSIAELFGEFGNQQGIQVQVSPRVRGEISGSFKNRTPASFLAQLSRAYGLSWFYVNGILYISTNPEVSLQVCPLRYVKAETVISMLKNSGFISSDGRVHKIEDSGMITISGIPHYIELVQKLIQSMDDETRFHNNGETVIEVFPLNNAWAYDVSMGGGGAVIQGVASTLRQLMWWYGMGGSGLGGVGMRAGVGGVGGFENGALNKYGAFNTGPSGPISATPNQMGAPNQTTGVIPPTSQQVPPGFAGNAPAMANSSEYYNKTSPAAAANGVPPSTESPYLPENTAAGPGGDWTFAMITADVRRNAVVIRDIRANMDLYEAAIRKLDVPVRVIEISAAIVDLELGASRTLGLNSLGINTGNFTVGDTTVNLSSGMSAVVKPGAGSNIGVTGVFGSTEVTAAINALSRNNRAKILSRPTILTLDNFGAMINQQETFYVNAVGQYVSNLYNVSTGLGLQVVPHVTMFHGEPRIYLQVQIQDGRTLPEGVGSIPKVEMSTLTTQSVIKKDQSLLVGGLFKKVDRKEASGYPWLYKIPLLGYLFGIHDRAQEMVERVFVITPRIIELSSSNLGDYSDYFQPGPTVDRAIKARQNDIDAAYENQSQQSSSWKSSTATPQPVQPASSQREPDTNIFQATGPHPQLGPPAPTPQDSSINKTPAPISSQKSSKKAKKTKKSKPPKRPKKEKVPKKLKVVVVGSSSSSLKKTPPS